MKTLHTTLVAGVLVASLGLIPADSARATVGAPFEISRKGSGRPVLQGIAYRDTLTITALEPATLGAFVLSGAGWMAPNWMPPASISLGVGQSLVLPFEATSNGVGAAPLVLGFEADNYDVRWTFDMSYEAYLRVLGNRPALVLADDRPIRQAYGDTAQTVLGGPALGGIRDGEDAPGGALEAPRHMAVHGRVVFDRVDGVRMAASGVTVRLFDEDRGIDDLIEEIEVGTSGSFRFSFDWSQAEDPDLYVQVVTENSEVRVRNYDIFSPAHSFVSATLDNVTSSSVNLGLLTSDEPNGDEALNIQTVLTSAHDFLGDHGIDTPLLTQVVFPSGLAGGMFTLQHTIYVSADDSSDDGAFLHEYGHVWLNQDAEGQTPATALLANYCAHPCDAPGAPACVHCFACASDPVIAWAEGFPEWFSDFIARGFSAAGVTLARPDPDPESVDSAACGDTTPDPCATEGLFAALLRDIEDGSLGFADTDSDPLTTGWDEIFRVADLDAVNTPEEFLNAFEARFGCIGGSLFRVARNEGNCLTGTSESFLACSSLDGSAPPNPGGSDVSPSHDVSVGSMDRTIDFLWATPADDCSGISGFAMSLTAGAGGDPGLIATISAGSAVTSHTTGDLSPGSYFLNLRSIDRSGRSAPGFVSFGPYVILPSTADLEFTPRAGWDFVALPGSGSASPGNVHVPASLNPAATYWNVSYGNAGTTATPSGINSYRVNLLLDGTAAGGIFRPTLGGTISTFLLNQGPVAVSPGRHTFEVHLDATEVVGEISGAEDDHWAHQWSWPGTVLSSDVPVTHAAPPNRTGGQNWIVDGSTIADNCDGFSATFGASGWGAVGLCPGVFLANFDLVQHAASGPSTERFASPLRSSTRSAGRVDALIYNRYLDPEGSAKEFAVTNRTSSAATYSIARVSAGVMNFGESVTIGLPAQMPLLLEDVLITPVVMPAEFQVDVTVTPPQAAQVAWFDQSFVSGSLDAASAETTADPATGQATLVVPAGLAGHYGLAVCRGAGNCGQAISVTLLVRSRAAAPDVPPPPAGWYASLVPRVSSDATAQNVPLSPNLTGHLALTFLNLALRNQSSTPIAAAAPRIFLDGASLAELPSTAWPAFGQVQFLNQGPVSIPGGRHTLAARLSVPGDPAAGTAATGEQFVWHASELIPGTAVTRPFPAPPTGGWNDLVPNTPLLYNCDGLRLAAAGGAWRAVAAMPAAGSNVDLRLHELAGGSRLGFEGSLAVSAWPVGQSDFVLVNTHRTTPRPFDVGVLNATGGSSAYTAESVTSGVPLTSNALNGPFTLGAGHLIDLHEVTLDPGAWTIELQAVSGAVDWGVSLYPGGLPYLSKSMVFEEAAAWLNGAGVGESFMVDIPIADSYAVAVWKVGAGDVAVAGTYRLAIGAGTSGTSDGVTAMPPGLAPPFPNPARTSTVLAFRLESAQTISLDLFAVDGRRVRCLLAGERPAGPLSVPWDFRDEKGRPVADGVYYARLRTARGESTRKLLLAR